MFKPLKTADWQLILQMTNKSILCMYIIKVYCAYIYIYIILYYIRLYYIILYYIILLYIIVIYCDILCKKKQLTLPDDDDDDDDDDDETESIEVHLKKSSLPSGAYVNSQPAVQASIPVSSCQSTVRVRPIDRLRLRDAIL